MATIVVINAGLSRGHASGSDVTTTITAATHTRTSTSSHANGAASKASAGTTSSSATVGAKDYVVKPGDSLSAIAARTGVSLASLEALNPGVDPRALHTGQHLKLHP